MKDKNNVPRDKRKMKQKQEYENMKQIGLEGIFDEISTIDSQKEICLVKALLLNELIKKEREIRLRGFHRQQSQWIL